MPVQYELRRLFHLMNIQFTNASKFKPKSADFRCIFQQLITLLKMLDLYLLGQNCLHLTFKPYLSSETYSRKYEKLPNIVVNSCKILQKNCIC